MIVMAWKWQSVRFLAQTSQCGYKRIFESRLINADLIKLNLRFAEFLLDDAFGFVWFSCEQIEPIAKSLNVENISIRTGNVSEEFFGLFNICCGVRGWCGLFGCC